MRTECPFCKNCLEYPDDETTSIECGACGKVFIKPTETTIEQVLAQMPVPVILFKNVSKECEDRAKLLLTTAHIYQKDTMVMFPLALFTKLFEENT